MQKILAGQRRDDKNRLEKITEENIADLRFSLNTIQKRSEGLLAFVDNYRRLTKVPKPENQPVHIKNFLNSIVRLMQTELHQKGIDITLTLQDENYVATFDPRLVEQVIINLITNSVHALENCEKPAITVHGYEDDANFYHRSLR
jgi:Signal transduction histidine kinase involved in nitrogen fixation and metabolism regulation